MLEKFKEQIFTLLERPAPGFPRLTVSAEQLNSIMLAETYEDAREAAIQYGWERYVKQFENRMGISEEETSTEEIYKKLYDDLLGQQSDPFIGVDSETIISYKGVDTPIGDVADNFYVNNDNNFSFINSTPDQIMELQASLVNAGLLGPRVGKPFRPGVWNTELEGKIMYNLMSQANNIGIGKAENGWQNVLESYIQNPVSLGLQVDPYLPPDYQGISTSINNLFERELGREPMPYELKLLANTYLSESEKAYNQKVMLFEEAQNFQVTADNLNEYGNHIQKKIIEEQGLTEIDPTSGMFDKFQQITAEERERLKDYGDIQKLIVLLLIVSQVHQGNIMEKDRELMNTNPNLINIYLDALKMKESSNNYLAQHSPSTIEDLATGKPISVQALGAYGILDINWSVWSKQAGLEGADWKDKSAQDAVAKYKVQEYFNKYGTWDLVSVAWFAGPGAANELKRTGTLDMEQQDSNGTDIADYVAGMNKLIGEGLMNMEVDIKPIEQPNIYSGPIQVSGMAQDEDTVFAAQLLNTIIKNNAGGVIPSLDADYKSQVPKQAGSIEAAKIKTQIRRDEMK